MATKKQITANRSNAQKSTEPKTAEGRQVASHNAETHGLFAKDVVAAAEDRKLFDTLLEALIEEHQPGTFTQTLIIERLAVSFWREKRHAAAERHMIEKEWADQKEQVARWQPIFGNSGDRDLSSSLGALGIQRQLLIGRYQALINNQIRQALKHLRDERSLREKTIEAAPYGQIANDADGDPLA